MKAIACIIFMALGTLFPIIAAGPGTAWGAGPDWVLVDENPDSSFYYDKAGVVKPQDEIVRVTMRVAYTEEGKAATLEILKPAEGYEKLSETRYLYDLDCKKRKSKLLRVIHLDGAGNKLKEFDLAEKTEWENLPPDARIEAVAESECGW